MEDDSIKWNAPAALAFMVGGWVVCAVVVSRRWAIGLFVSSRNLNPPRVVVNEALFTTSLVWYAPFFAELLVLLEWQLQGMLAEKFEHFVLGGAGFNDILFVLGFATLVSSGLYALTIKTSNEKPAPAGQSTRATKWEKEKMENQAALDWTKVLYPDRRNPRNEGHRARRSEASSCRFP